MILIPKKYLNNQSCVFCSAHNTPGNSPVRFMVHIDYPLGVSEGYDYGYRPAFPICKKCAQELLNHKISCS